MTTLKTEAVGIRVEPPIKAAPQTAAERKMPNLAHRVEFTGGNYWHSKIDKQVGGVVDENVFSVKPGQSSL